MKNDTILLNLISSLPIADSSKEKVTNLLIGLKELKRTPRAGEVWCCAGRKLISSMILILPGDKYHYFHSKEVYGPNIGNYAEKENWEFFADSIEKAFNKLIAK